MPALMLLATLTSHALTRSRPFTNALNHRRASLVRSVACGAVVSPLNVQRHADVLLAARGRRDPARPTTAARRAKAGAAGAAGVSRRDVVGELASAGAGEISIFAAALLIAGVGGRGRKADKEVVAALEAANSPGAGASACRPSLAALPTGTSRVPLEVSASSADIEYLWLRDASGVVAVKKFGADGDRAFTFSASPLDRGKTLTPVAYGTCGLWVGDSLTI